MIYLLIIIIISIYFIFFFKNIGEGSSVNFRNKKLAAIIIIPLLLIIGIFFKNSGIINYVEYNSILDKHHEIRKNIPELPDEITAYSKDCVSPYTFKLYLNRLFKYYEEKLKN